MKLASVKNSNPNVKEFTLEEDNLNIGKIQIRIEPTKSTSLPGNFESNIYYEINPESQGKGYGNKILELGILEARKLNLKRLTLVHLDTNLASGKIIQNNGGKLLETKRDSLGNIHHKHLLEL